MVTVFLDSQVARCVARVGGKRGGQVTVRPMSHHHLAGLTRALQRCAADGDGCCLVQGARVLLASHVYLPTGWNVDFCTNRGVPAMHSVTPRRVVAEAGPSTCSDGLSYVADVRVVLELNRHNSRVEHGSVMHLYS